MTTVERPPRWTLPFIALILAGMFAAAWLGHSGWNWLLVAVCLSLFLAVIGWHLVGRADGILINERNLISLARFQMVLWTVIILSGYFTMAFGRIKAGVEDPLSIAMDWHLWALMGISTASLIGSPLISSPKKEKEPADDTVKKVAAGLKENPTEIEDNRQGILYSNPTIANASFADMFQGDELQNTKYLDLAKIQMFLFTIIAATAYGVTLWNTFTEAKTDPGSLETMPGLSEGLRPTAGYLPTQNRSRFEGQTHHQSAS